MVLDWISLISRGIKHRWLDKHNWTTFELSSFPFMTKTYWRHNKQNTCGTVCWTLLSLKTYRKLTFHLHLHTSIYKVSKSYPLILITRLRSTFNLIDKLFWYYADTSSAFGEETSLKHLYLQRRCLGFHVELANHLVFGIAKGFFFAMALAICAKHAAVWVTFFSPGARVALAQSLRADPSVTGPILRFFIAQKASCDFVPTQSPVHCKPLW